MANTKLLEREIHNMAAAKMRRVTIHLAVGGETSGASIDAVGDAAARAVAGQKGCKLVRCVLTGAGAGALAFELAYDDSTANSEQLAEDRSHILRSLIEQLAAAKLPVMRASEQPPAPLPF